MEEDLEEIVELLVRLKEHKVKYLNLINAIIESINPEFEKLYHIYWGIKKLEAKYYKLHKYAKPKGL
jgi:hypothetical protein